MCRYLEGLTGVHACFSRDVAPTDLQAAVASHHVTANVMAYLLLMAGLTYTVREKGFFALYRGLAPTLIASFPKAGIRFGGNAYFKDLLRDENGKLTPGERSASRDLGQQKPWQA